MEYDGIHGVYASRATLRRKALRYARSIAYQSDGEDHIVLRVSRIKGRLVDLLHEP